MLKSIINIIAALIIILFLFFLIYGLPMISLDSTFKDETKYQKNVTITSYDDEYLNINEKIIIDVDNTYKSFFHIPIVIYKEHEYDSFDIESLEVTFNSKKVLQEYELNSKYLNSLVYKNIDDNFKYSFKVNSIILSTKDSSAFKPGKYVLNINYNCKVNEVIEKYNNVSLLRLRRNTNFDSLKINITLPNSSSNMQINSKNAILNKLNNINYLIDLSEVKTTHKNEYVGLVFDRGAFINAKRINDNYDIEKETYIFANEENENVLYLFIILAITLVIFVIVSFLTKKIKTNVNYIRDPKLVISPVLAESLVERKMRI